MRSFVLKSRTFGFSSHHISVGVNFDCHQEACSDVSVVGEATNGKEAVAIAAALRPSIGLMDINMPNMNGIDATAVIKQKWPDITVIGLSVNADGDNQAAMISAGATFLLTKEAAVDELYRAIQEVLRIK